MGPVGIILISLFGAFVLLFLLYILVSYILVKTLSFPKKATIEFSHNYYVEHGIIPKDMSYLKREPLQIVARDGCVIEGDFSYNEENRGIMIIAHGYSWTREGGLKYAQFFFKHGFSIFLFDERYHGLSKFTHTTMGYLEGKDICDIISYFRLQYGSEIPIGLQGESMGAASVLMALGENPSINFAIEDCGYADLKDLLVDKIRERHISPKIILPGCDFFLKHIIGYSLDMVRPIENAKKSHVPLLIIHGEDDDFVPYRNASLLYSALSDHAKFISFPGAKHAVSYESNPLLYENECMKFIDEVLS